jgi:Fe-S-cluster-containing hydrogenase component 2
MEPVVVKRETATYLELSLTMYVDRVELRLDKTACLKCDICAAACPRGAVAVVPGDAELDITIDPRLCLLCEVCAHFCPVGAVTLTYNGEKKTIFGEHRGLAPFLPKVEMDKGKCLRPCPTAPEGELHWCRRQLQLTPRGGEPGCPKECHRCLQACPRQAIVLDSEADVIPAPDRCLRCAQCLEACEQEAIVVNPQFLGRLVLDDRWCPPDCNKCIDLCPVKAIVREGERVFLKLPDCTYCGVCRNICDQGAITLQRRKVVAEPGEFSRAWEQAVARLLGEGEEPLPPWRGGRP